MRYIIAALIFVGLLTLAIILIITGFSTKSNKPKPISLSAQYKTGLEIRYVNDGPINNNTVHKSVVITVNDKNINLTVFQGYNGHVLITNNYQNTPNSYKNFLASLGYYGYMSSKPSNFKSVTGLCPLGSRYSYQILNSSNGLNQNLFSTTCGEATEAGNIGGIQEVIQNQIPNYYQAVNPPQSMPANFVPAF
jgi:hypothetical protein